MKVLIIITVVLLAPVARCQAVFQVDAGGGDLLSGGAFAEGIGVTTYFPNQTLYTGLAVRDGHVIAGASDTFLFHDLKTTIGDQMIGLNTGNVGLGLALKGVSIHRELELACSDAPKPPMSRMPGYGGIHCSGGWALTLFTGATGPGVFLPFQQYARPQHLGAGFLAQQKLRDFQFSGLCVLEGGARTLIGVAEYNFHQRIQATMSAGMLNNQRYAQALGSVRPIRSVSFYGSHSSFFEPFPARGNSVGATLTAGRFTAQAALNESSSLGIKVHGENVGAGVRIGFVSGQSNWYKSDRQSLLTHSITENLRRFTFTEIISQAAGRNSFSFGAGYHSNRFSVSVSHNVQFLLGGQGYQQVLGISISFRLHDTTVSASTIFNPVTGKTLWNVVGEQYIQAEGLSLRGHETHSTGKYLIAGECILEDGTAVEGCAVVIGKQIVFSNSRGRFETRQKNTTASISVRVEEFAAPGSYTVVSAPATATAHEPIQIVVRK